MNEKDLLDQIKKSAENITPPDSLKPEHLEAKLNQQNAADKNTSGKAAGEDVIKTAFHKSTEGASGKVPEENADKDVPKNSPSKIKRFPVYRLGGIAAVFVLAVVGLWQVNHISSTARSQKNHSTIAIASRDAITGTAESETEAATTAAALESALGTEAASLDEAAESFQDAEAAEEAASSASFTTASDSQELYDLLYKKFGNEPSAALYDTGTMAIAENSDVSSESAVDLSLYAKASVDSASGGTTYSETNIQELGVDEGDFVKTDGQCIYILKRSGQFLIVSARKGQLVLLSSTSLPLEDRVQELYLDGQTLSIITSGYYTELNTETQDVYSASSTNRTNLYTYDITDPAAPRLTGTVTQDGTYQSSRKNGSYIYLFTQYSPTIAPTYEGSHIIPKTSSGALSVDDIYLPDSLNYASYLVISSISIQQPDQILDQKAVVSVASDFYISAENIYIANESWSDANTHTELIKLHYAEGQITAAAAGSVDGYLNNSFSLNEYDGYLRVVSTSYDADYNETNDLYVLDENLNLVGSIPDLAPDETIRSARFLGTTGYFVTFRQTDPLFSIDLSDPANPKVLGALKVSGFSSYLHFYSDNLLLGLGYEADESTGATTGLKLSMFDISDPSNVTETDRLVLDGITWCDSLEDYKSILIDPQKNLFGFTCDNRYLLFSYDPDTGFTKEFIYDFYNDMIEQSLQPDTTGTTEAAAAEGETATGTTEIAAAEDETATESAADVSISSTETVEIGTLEETDSATEDIASYYLSNTFAYSEDSTTRGLYIDDTLYLVRPNAVTAFDMTNNYQEIGRLMLS